MNRRADHPRNALEPERAGCLLILGAAIGTWFISVAIAIAMAYVIQSAPFYRIGQVLGTVLLVHMIAFAVARLWIRRAQLRRFSVIVVATEVGLVLALLLLAALTPG